MAGFKPKPLSATEARAADRVVVIAFDGPVDAATNAPMERWNDVAPVGLEYAKAKHTLQSHIETLLDSLSRPGGP